jgi:hypothetical protein
VNVVAPPEPGKAISIDAVRDLIHAMALRPVRPGPRIAIVRDAQQLTPQAQGAMLKLLEEPPGFALLALVTDNASALLATIRSRCQTLRFAPLAAADVRRVLETHGRDAALFTRAAAVARGSAGAALALTTEAVEERAAVITAFEALRSGETREVDSLAADLVERRKDGRAGVEALLEWQMRKVQVSLAGGTTSGTEAAGRTPAPKAAANTAPQSGALELDDDTALATLLASAASEPADVLLDEAARTLWAVQALERNGNPKLVLRELLLGVRDGTRDR